MNDNAFNGKGKMMKQNDLFINASQIAEMTNMSEAYAYKWYVSYFKLLWNGKKQRTVKRGFNTKKEAENFLAFI